MNTFSGFQTKQFCVLQEVVTTASIVWYLVSNVRSASESNSIVLKKYLYLKIFCSNSFRYKCHKACARNAPFSCGLPPELEEYFRKRVLCYNNPEPSSLSVPLADVFRFRILIKNHHKVCVQEFLY